MSFAYADAHLTSDFSLPANDGTQTGTIVPGLIHGSNGQQMPGSPKTSASVALDYDTDSRRATTLCWRRTASIAARYRCS